MCDLQWGATPELIIRESDYGRLKTDQAKRRIPLKGLLTESELAKLQLYWEERRATLMPTDPLFSNPDAPAEPLDPAQIFGPITKALRFATGDSEMVPHAMRHSFLNFGLLKLHAADGTITLPTEVFSFQNSTMSLQACQAFKNAIFEREPGDTPDTGRRNVFAMSLILGHLSTATSIQIYFHVADLATYIFRNRQQPLVTNPDIRARLLGVSKSRMYQIADKHGVHPKNFDLGLTLSVLRSTSLRVK